MSEINVIVAVLGLVGGAILVPAQTPSWTITLGVSAVAALVAVLTGAVVDGASLFEVLSLAKPSSGFAAVHLGLAVGAIAGQLLRTARRVLSRP